MKYLLGLDIGEIVDGFVSNYLSPKHDNKDTYLKRIKQSIQTKFGYSLWESVEFAIKMGETYSHKFTFFVVGKLAENNPGLVEYILGKGHEVASHSMTHIIPLRLTPESFLRELVDSKEILESFGAKVTGFRAPHLLLYDSQYLLLHKAGYLYSSSKLWNHRPITFEFNSGEVKEIPITYEDWGHVQNRKNHLVLLETISSAISPGSVLLFHPTFMVSPQFEDIWKELFTPPQRCTLYSSL